MERSRDDEKEDLVHVYDGNKKARNNNSKSLHKEFDSLSKVEYRETVKKAGVDPDHVESILAREMLSLTMDDRQQVYFDVHGVSQPVQESPEMLSTSIETLQHNIEEAVGSETRQTALVQAWTTNRNFVNDSAFLIKFLRAEEFQIDKAATRIERFFEMKLDLFGHESLCQELHMDDLDRDAQRVLYAGRMQNMLKDQVGRNLAIQYVQSSDHPVRAKAQATFYLSSVGSRDEDVQRHGVVNISYLVGQDLKFFEDLQHRKEWNTFLARCVDAVSLKGSATHCCHNSRSVRFLLALFKLTISTSARLKVREHYGNAEECKQQLRSYGIPTDHIQIDEKGNIPLEAWHNHLESTRLQERKSRQLQSSQTSNETLRNQVIAYPSQHDVLLGRGKASYRYPGNIQLRELVKARVVEYNKSTKSGKVQLSNEIVDTVHKRCAYFLEADGDAWRRVDDKVARLKVSHLFRRC